LCDFCVIFAVFVVIFAYFPLFFPVISPIFAVFLLYPPQVPGPMFPGVIIPALLFLGGVARMTPRAIGVNAGCVAVAVWQWLVADRVAVAGWQWCGWLGCVIASILIGGKLIIGAILTVI
jgi:hypothetical protein